MPQPDPHYRPSLRDIARELGMSHVAVSLALRGSPRVSAARREEVKAMAEKLGYRPDPMLASLVAYRQGKRPTEIRSCLGWINQWDPPEALRSFKEFDRYWQGASEAAEKLGYRLEEFRWPKGKSGKRLQTILQTRGVRGLLIPPHRNGMDLPDFDWSQFSLIRFGASVENLRVHTVTSDQSHCSRLAYEKARELGYRRIGYASHIQFEKNTKGHFREGYLNAQEELAPHRSHLEVLELGNDASRQAKDFSTWFKRYKPDAIISTLPNVRELIEGLKLRVPKDVAVATTSLLDGNFDSGSDQNSQEIGRVAVSTLAGLIIENERGIPAYQRRILVEGRWVQGTSMPPATAM
ncbi:MAG: LacI family DNA-binding transcriptional regulator [Rariglobus sp.]|nr:LacI family DNA-binding transcriptional regulator [Rariglobus sp.]